MVSLGPILLLPVAGVVALMLRQPGARESAFGALSGAGFLLLYIAYVQRDGPGTTCKSLPLGGEQCDEHLNPLPWLVLGILLVVAGVVAEVRASRRSA
jgi:hypothetical protein